MVEYAEHQFNLHKPRKGGKVIDQLKQVEKQTGRKLKELQAPPFPEPLQDVWAAFLKLNKQRHNNGSTALALAFSEIKCFTELTNTVLSAREVEVIQLLDEVYIRTMNSDG